MICEGFILRFDGLRSPDTFFSGNSHLILRVPHPCSLLTHNPARLNRNAFAITDTELKLIAALAIIGLNNHPNTG